VAELYKVLQFDHLFLIVLNLIELAVGAPLLDGVLEIFALSSSTEAYQQGKTEEE
jgi:hypothetical protein